MRRAIDGNPIQSSKHGDVTSMGIFGKHLGYDYAVTNQPVFAPVAGVIRMSGDSGPTQVGQYIELDGGGHWHRFLHLSSRSVPVGATVAEGQQIAISGNTGVTTGPHLHHDVRVPSVWNASFANYIDWERKLAAAAVVPTTPGVPAVDNNVVGRILYLKPHVARWRIYAVGTKPQIGKEKAFLQPAYYGGLSYRILATTPHPQTVEIQTTYFGRVWIYVDGDGEIR